MRKGAMAAEAQSMSCRRRLSPVASTTPSAATWRTRPALSLMMPMTLRITGASGS